jgi:hypothetical protein
VDDGHHRRRSVVCGWTPRTAARNKMLQEHRLREVRTRDEADETAAAQSLLVLAEVCVRDKVCNVHDDDEDKAVEVLAACRAPELKAFCHACERPTIKPGGADYTKLNKMLLADAKMGTACLIRLAYSHLGDDLLLKLPVHKAAVVRPFEPFVLEAEASVLRKKAYAHGRYTRGPAAFIDKACGRWMLNSACCRTFQAICRRS